MSLATRCPACGTIFRVVQDQLKVSEGWVRCGQCHEVFHGIESLFDIGSDPALAVRRAARQGGEDGSAADPSTDAARSTRPGVPHPDTDASTGGPAGDAAHEPPAGADDAPPWPGPAAVVDDTTAPPAGAAGIAPAAAQATWDDGERGDSRFDVTREMHDFGPADDRIAARRLAGTIGIVHGDRDAPDDDPGHDAGPETLASLLPEPVGEWPPRRRSLRRAATGVPRRHDPRFLREAHRVARWSRPWVRGMLATLVIVLGLLAAGQVALPMRDALAARWPATAPAWQAFCELAHCTVDAPRALASLTLDGSSLVRTETDRVLMFTADLRNRADHPVRMPAFDLKFTDLNGQVVARKVFEPGQLGIAQKALAAEAELHVKVRLHLDSPDVAGFQAEVFYP